MTERMSLNGSDWQLKDFVGEDWIWRHSEKPDTRDVRWWRSGTVPGSVHHDLLQLGEIPDPYVDRNSLLVEWVPERTWLYRKAFTPPAEWSGRRIRLHFEGIDYEAQVFLNGKLLGRHRGMYTPAVFEVGGELKCGEPNLLAVVLEKAPDEQPQVSKTAYVRTHKSRMTYWWDFCPRMIHVGIWDDVYLEASGSVLVEDAFVRPVLNADYTGAELAVAVRLHAAEPVKVELETSIYELPHQGDADADGRRKAGAEASEDARAHPAPVAVHRSRHMLAAGETETNALLLLERPRLWWPNGYGEQPLYEARVAVRVVQDAERASDTAGGGNFSRSSEPSAFEVSTVAHEKAVTFGVRRIELALNERADPAAQPYTFVVNGRRVYINGWNWVPIDVMYGVPRPAKLKRLLTLAKRANVNMLRVWGGGLIEKEAFYDQCDRLGILVWQEFIQSSSGIANKPSEDPDFIGMMTDEAEQIVPRKRNHPSLALWCGGNELQGPGDVPLDNREPVLGALAAVVKRLDPDRHWLPTSPTGRLFSNSLANIEADPGGLHDVHGPWEHQGLTAQYSLYNRGTSLLHSEFGVEGMTNRRTLDRYVSSAKQWPPSRDNAVYFHRGSWWINETLVQQSFGGGIGDIDTMIRASQLLQAEGLRYAVESNRRRQYQNSGTLPWQFNEPYPNNYCTSAIDYEASPKPVYYAVARAYKETTVTAAFPTQAWEGKNAFTADLFLSRAATEPLSDLRLTARLIAADGRELGSKQIDASAPGNGSAPVGEVRFALQGLGDDDIFFLDLQLTTRSGLAIATNRYPFVRTATLAPLLEAKPTQLTASCLKEGDEWSLTLANDCDYAALCVWLEEDRPLVEAAGYVYMEDNHFSLLPGESRTVRVHWEQVPEEQKRLSIAGWNTGRIER